jgi:hypothetical protein
MRSRIRQNAGEKGPHSGECGYMNGQNGLPAVVAGGIVTAKVAKLRKTGESMRVFSSGLLASLLFVCLSPVEVRAQGRKPPVSPYLNLARRDVNPAINYYGLVRPQLEFRNAIQRLDNQLTADQQGVPGSDFSADVPVTGQRAQFQTQNKYFFNAGAGVAGLPGTTRGIRPGFPGTGGIPGVLPGSATGSAAARRR